MLELFMPYEDPLQHVNKEWMAHFIAEEKTLYGEHPSNSEILRQWENNKDYFYSFPRNAKSSIWREVPQA